MEGALPVVPEREGPGTGAGVAGAGQVRQTPAQQCGEALALGLAAQVPPSPAVRIVHITVVGRDVEVADQQQRITWPLGSF
ncbi:MAG TPA: hypothetical protein VJ370_07320, partial [Streptosporangiaceae bacterium]|nr:hypothetical protein [Streptosporangiaceae bacterium]